MTLALAGHPCSSLIDEEIHVRPKISDSTIMPATTLSTSIVASGLIHTVAQEFSA